MVVGSAGDEVVYNGVTALSNGNYVVSSAFWNGNRGAATWGSGSTGVSGTVSASNSLVGSSAGDRVGGFNGATALSTRNSVATTPFWNVSPGAGTRGAGAAGVSGAVSDSHSLGGSSANVEVIHRVTGLSHGNYVARSPSWNGSRGAATWGSGTTGVSGAVSESNSLVGSSANDHVSYPGVA